MDNGNNEQPYLKSKLQDAKRIGEIVNAHDQAEQELGKELFLRSIEVSREFCKQMITISSGAIPLYLAILSYVKQSKECIKLSIFFSAFPIVLFLLALICFVVGYFPKTGGICLTDFLSIKKAIRDTIRKRKVAISWGVTFFLSAMILSIIILLNFSIL